VDEIPGPQAALLIFDHEHALPGDDEEVLLAALAVVHAVRLPGQENVDAKAELGELVIPFEVGVLPQLLVSPPGHVPRIEDEPSLTRRDAADLRLL